MNKIIISLLNLLFIELTLIGYLRFFYTPTFKVENSTPIKNLSHTKSIELDELVTQSIQEIMTKAKTLPCFCALHNTIEKYLNYVPYR